MSVTSFEPGDSTVFLAMYWIGGGPFKLQGLIDAYDCVNRSIPNADELEGALNRFLASELISQESDGFLVPATVCDSFDSFRKRRRKDRFEMATAFLGGFK